MSKEIADSRLTEPIRVGTIEIQISKTDRDFTHTQTATLPDQESKGWDAPVSGPGIVDVPPTHEIMFVTPTALFFKVQPLTSLVISTGKP